MQKTCVCIGGYRIVKVLKQKVGSAVYLGSHEKDSHYGVIKVLTSPFIFNRQHVERFVREAQILQQASHPCIVKFYHHGEWEKGLYLAMEFVPGISLKDYIITRSISLPQAIEIILMVAEALGHLHSQKLLHRDIKPDNIILTPDGRVKLIDLGLAAWGEGRPSTCIGTLGYMSPEQDLNGALTPASDLYSLAIVAYELILGGLSAGKVHLSLLPERIARLLARALQPNPEARYPSVKAWISALREYQERDLIADLRYSDVRAIGQRDLSQQREWLSPQELSLPHWLSGEVQQTEYSPFPYVYYEGIPSPFGYSLWFCFSPTDFSVLALAVMKNLVSQWGDQQNIRNTLYRIHEEFLRMHVPVGREGLSVVCLVFLQEKQEVSCFSCGKTTFSLKKQEGVMRCMTTQTVGLGAPSPLHIQETKVAWEIGDEAVLRNLWDFTAAPPSYTELKDRKQSAIFCPAECRKSEDFRESEVSPYPSMLISLKRVR